MSLLLFFFFQAEDGIRDLVRSRGLGDVYKRQHIFSDYAYFSSFSDVFLQHAKDYVDMAVERFSLSAKSYVVEIASNDGYLLQNFVARGIRVLGIEPAKNVAEVAVKKGVPSCVKFFGTQTARELVAEERRPDLIIGNNVLAHVPDLNDFVGGLKICLLYTSPSPRDRTRYRMPSSA